MKVKFAIIVDVVGDSPDDLLGNLDSDLSQEFQEFIVTTFQDFGYAIRNVDLVETEWSYPNEH